jgi:hypothetical protein
MAHVGSEQILQGPVLGHAGNSFSLAKRRKTKLACNECRQVKTRCDGNMPACSRCEKKGLTSRCQYEQSTLRTQRYDLLPSVAFAGSDLFTAIFHFWRRGYESSNARAVTLDLDQSTHLHCTIDYYPRNGNVPLAKFQIKKPMP